MTIGSATINAAIAAALATLVWWIVGKLGGPAWLALFLFGVILLVVFAAGPLVRLP